MLSKKAISASLIVITLAIISGFSYAAYLTSLHRHEEQEKIREIDNRLAEVLWLKPLIKNVEPLTYQLPVKGFYSGPHNATKIAARITLKELFKPTVSSAHESLQSSKLAIGAETVESQETSYELGKAFIRSVTENNDTIVTSKNIWLSETDNEKISKAIFTAAVKCSEATSAQIYAERADFLKNEIAITRLLYSPIRVELLSGGVYPDFRFKGLIFNPSTQELFYLECS